MAERRLTNKQRRERHDAYIRREILDKVISRGGIDEESRLGISLTNKTNNAEYIRQKVADIQKLTIICKNKNPDRMVKEELVRCIMEWVFFNRVDPENPLSQLETDTSDFGIMSKTQYKKTLQLLRNNQLRHILLGKARPGELSMKQSYPEDYKKLIANRDPTDSYYYKRR